MHLKVIFLLISCLVVYVTAAQRFVLKHNPFYAVRSPQILEYEEKIQRIITFSASQQQLNSRHMSLLHRQLPECDMRMYIPVQNPDGEVKFKGGQSNGTMLVQQVHTGEKFVFKRYNKEKDYNNELHVHQHIQHPNIIEPVCVSTPELAFLLPYIEGGDLWRDGLEFQETDGMIVKYAAQLILAVEAMHQQGFVHHDIKPHNLVRYKGSPHIVLIDFGLAAPTNLPAFKRGTRLTMSPEVAKIRTDENGREIYQKEQLHEGLDWWSVGVTIYMLQLLKSVPPGERKPNINFIPYRFTESNHSITYADIPPEFSEDLCSLLHMLLHPDPAMRRFNTPELLAVLKSHPYFVSINWDLIYL